MWDLQGPEKLTSFPLHMDTSNLSINVIQCNENISQAQDLRTESELSSWERMDAVLFWKWACINLKNFWLSQLSLILAETDDKHGEEAASRFIQ